MDMHSNYTEVAFCSRDFEKRVSLVGLGIRLFASCVGAEGAVDLKYFTENLLTYFLPVRTTAQLCLKDQWAEYVENEES